MKARLTIFCLLIIFLSGKTFSQSNSNSSVDEWLLTQQNRQYDYLKNFSTMKYICEEKKSIKFIFDIDKKLWRQELDKHIKNSDKNRLTIIKSDDIKERIGLCEAKDQPISSDRHLNKFFCIVEQWNGGATHHKCLLEIDENISKGVLIHTLVCGKGNFKFNLTHSKIFDNNFGIGPYSPYQNTLEQDMVVSDCMKFGNK